jgi:hypothetical protein
MFHIHFLACIMRQVNRIEIFPLFVMLFIVHFIYIHESLSLIVSIFNGVNSKLYKDILLLFVDVRCIESTFFSYETF